MFKLISVFAVFLALTSPAIVVAQTGGSNGGGYGGGYGGGSGGEGSRAGLSSTITRSVTRALTRGAASCHRLPWIYRYDCYTDVYRDAANLIAGNPAYKEAYAALAKVEKVLEQEVARNIDPKAPRVRRGVKTYQPIKKSSVPKVTKKTEIALQEAETTLLRSASDKGTHYTRIADAVNSNKVLLRSALLLLPGVGPILRAVV